MSGTKIVTQSAETKKSSLYRKTFKYWFLSAPPTVSTPKKSDTFEKAFVRQNTTFLEGWGHKLTFAKGDIDNLLSKIEGWRAKGEIDPDEYNTALSYLAENNLDSLIDELMLTGARP